MVSCTLMTDQEKKLIFDLINRRISEADFLATFSANPRVHPSWVIQALDDACRARSASDAECAMLLGFYFKAFDHNFVDILCELIVADWHRQHENIAMVMQKLRDPRCVEPLYQTALARFPYLAYDDAHALAVKCLWALSDTNTEEARHKLELLTKSEIAIIRENAERLLKRSLERRGG